MIYDAQIPKEPVKGAVVLDRHGIAWQRDAGANGYWHRAAMATTHPSTQWAYLVAGQGPLTLLHDPENK